MSLSRLPVLLHAKGGGGGGRVAESVERAIPDEEILCSIPAVPSSSLLVGSVSV